MEVDWRPVKRLLVVAVAAVVLAPPAAAAPPSVEARAFLVVNGRTGEVLAGRNARARLPVASITKLMTALLAVERARPSGAVTVAPGAAAVGGATINLRAGERLSVRDLLRAALIQSANDAANALAFHVGGGSDARFVSLMNQRARSLGLSDTHFVRPDGLDVPGHLSSARDVTALARYAMQRPAIRDAVRRPTAIVAGGRTLRTWNDLLWSFRGLIGVKTGHTSRAGWSQVAAARRGHLTIYATILGSPSRSQRNADLAKLLAWGFSRYRAVAVVSREQVYARAELGYGLRPLALVPERPAGAVVRVDRPLVERVVAATVAELPVRRGQRLGEVRIVQGRRVLARRPLVAARSASRPGLPGRVTWYAGRAAKHVVGWIT